MENKNLEILQSDYENLREKYAENPPKTVEDWQRIQNMVNLITIIEYEQGHSGLMVTSPKNAHAAFDLMDAAVDELADAQKYFEQYQAIGDGRFLTMSKAELGHVAYLKAMMMEQGRAQEAQQMMAKLQQLEKVIR